MLTEAQVTDFKGYKGNFTTKYWWGRAWIKRMIEHGVTIVATGAHEYQPKEFAYGENPG